MFAPIATSEASCVTTTCPYLREVAGARDAATRRTTSSGILLGADVLRLPAPGAEPASRRRVRRARNVALEHDLVALTAQRRVGHRHRRQQRLRVRVGRRLVDLGVRADLDDACPRYMTATRSAMCRTTDRSCAMKMYERPNSSCRSSSRFITCAWTDTSSADTGSSQMMISGRSARPARDADALPLPAGELVRVPVDVVGVEPDDLEQLLHRRLRSPLGATSGWIWNGSPTMSPTVIRGFSDVYGSCSTIWIWRRSRRRSRPLSEKMSCPLYDHLARRRALEHHEQLGQRRLAAARLADQAEGLAAHAGRR